MSSESDIGQRIALLYGAQIARLDRPARLAWVQQRLDALAGEDASERQAHARDCADCRAGRFCADRLMLTTAQAARHGQTSLLRAAAAIEARDQEYANRARAHGVVYEHHIDGFNAYWQNIRHRLFVVAGHRCQRCGGCKPLEAHHRHYDTLGFEELCDLEALCRDCHQIADRQRGAQARYAAGLATYAEKKYGDAADYMSTDELEEEFDRWLEDRDDY